MITSTANIGSSRTGRALRGLLEGLVAGDLEGQLGVVDVVVGAVLERDLHVDHGQPASTPNSMASCAPWSTDGMYSRGMRPPDTLLTNS